MKFQVGDRVMFKSDIEQYGRIIKIQNRYATVRMYDGVTWRHRDVAVPLSRCYPDE
jgi:hypothetical protein